MYRNLKRKNEYLCLYTVGFVLTGIGVFIWYLRAGKTLIWRGDSYQQHYKALIYYAKYIREIIKTLITEYRLVIPKWDMSIGEGNDILQVLNYYGIGDPFYALAVLVPSRYMHIYYDAMVILRMYVTGLGFLWMYVQIRGGLPGDRVRKWILVFSGLSYAFCFWNVYNAARHPFFINMSLYLPIIIGSVEKYLKKNNGLPLILGIFFCGISNLYCFYVVAVLVVVYVVVRLVPVFLKDRKECMRSFLGISACAIVAVLLGAIVIFPVAFAFLSDARNDIDYYIGLFYSKNEYLSMLKLFVEPGVDDYWVCGGFGMVGLISFVVLFFTRGYHALKAYIGIAVIFFVFPFFGHVLNAMGYVTNRWIFALALLISFTVAEMVPRLLKMIRDRNVQRIACALTVLLMTGTLIYNSYVNNAPSKDNYASSCLDADGVFDGIAYCDAVIVDNYKKQTGGGGGNEFSRYETRYRDYNNSILCAQSSTQFYWTLSNPNVVQFRKDILTNNAILNMVDGYDERLIPDSLSGVKYYIMPKGSTPPLPVMSLLNIDPNADLYENPYYPGASYSYDRLIPESEWLKRDIMTRENLMMKGMVVKDSDLDGEIYDYAESFAANSDAEVLGSLSRRSVVSDGTLALDIPISRKTNGETLAVIKGLWFEGNSTVANIRISTNHNTDNYIAYRTEYDQYYEGFHDFAANLYCGSMPVSNVRVEFLTSGTYTFDSIDIMCHSLDHVLAGLSDLKDTGMTDVRLGIDSVTGCLDVGEGSGKYLCLTVPYSKGWSAYIDGQKTKLFPANIKYMGIKVPAGSHSIEFRYRTPLYMVGFVVSIITFIGVSLYYGRKFVLHKKIEF